MTGNRRRRETRAARKRRMRRKRGQRKRKSARRRESLTGVHDDQDSLPSLVNVGELGVVRVEDGRVVVEVVLERLEALDLDGSSLGVFGYFGGEVGHSGSLGWWVVKG
jgi:hypothetical protein